MDRNYFISIKEFLRYDKKSWGSRDEWKAKRHEYLLKWNRSCAFLRYDVDFADPCLCWEFLDMLEDEVEKRCNEKVTPARLCMKIIDKCQSESPTIPYPPSFLEHKNKLYEAEKLSA